MSCNKMLIHCMFKLKKNMYARSGISQKVNLPLYPLNLAAQLDDSSSHTVFLINTAMLASQLHQKITDD